MSTLRNVLTLLLPLLLLLAWLAFLFQGIETHPESQEIRELLEELDKK